MILTTDHGLPFPGGKSTLSDRGLGVLLIMRGPGGFHGGRVTRRARLPDRPVPDDLRADRRSSGPSTCRAARCCRSCARERREVNDAVFGEITYHAAYDPQRAVRTRRHKYIRR